MIDAQSPDLVRYLAEFGLSLSDLRPGQTAMFVAARNSAQYVEDLEVPVGSQLLDQSDTFLTEREADRILELTTYDAESLESHLPADEMDVCPIRSTEDLVRIFPVQWMLEETQPDAFYAKLAQQELLMPQWQRPAERPRDSRDDSPQRELVREAATAEAAKQHAYVLLDTSSTMQDHDRRGTVARGLALESLRKGYQQRAQLHVRPFTLDVGELSSGAGRDDFRTIARRITELPNAGQTRIQAALEQAVRDIRNGGACLGACIVLITDGISRLTQNPLGDERLHTFILGDLLEEQGAAGTIGTLRHWSHALHRIWKNRFAEILAPTERDCRAAGLELAIALRDARHDPSGAKAARARRLAENVRYLLQEYDRSLGKGAPIPPEIRALAAQLDDAEQTLGAGADEGPAMPGGQLSGSQPLPARRLGPSFLGELLPGRTGLWEHLVGLAVRAWRWAGRTCRALLRRKPADSRGRR